MVCGPLRHVPRRARGSRLPHRIGARRVRGGRLGLRVGLPPGLKDGSRLPKPIFTPATKAALGDHDENVTFDHVVATIGQEEATTLRRLTMRTYEVAAGIAADRGLLSRTRSWSSARPPTARSCSPTSC